VKRMVILPFLLIAAGCATTGPYADFAKAGRTYASALDAVLDKAADVHVNATSEDLLRSSQLKNLDEARFKQRMQDDQDFLTVQQDLRDHAKVLADYFDALEALADASAPSDAEAGAEKAYDALKKAGAKLAGRAAVKKASKLIVSGIESARLRRELNDHAEALREEMQAEHDLMTSLRAQLTTRSEATAVEQRQRLRDAVVNGFPSDPAAWIEERRNLLRRPEKIAELDDATAALDKLQEAFDKLATGALAPVTMRSIVHDLEVKLKHGGE
jgi:hypothetical protein